MGLDGKAQPSRPKLDEAIHASREAVMSFSALDPNAPEFLPMGLATAGEKMTVSLSSSLDTSAGGSTPPGGNSEHGGSVKGTSGPMADLAAMAPSSLVFGGGGDFLSKYHHLRKDKDEAGLGAESSLRQRRVDNSTTPPAATATPHAAPATLLGATSSAASSSTAGVASRGAKAAAPDRMNLQINSLLVQARTVEKILQVGESHMDQLNSVNVITALHRLATAVAAAKKAALRRDPRFKRLVSTLSEILRNADSESLKPQDLSNVAWALTKLGLLNSALFSNLAEHILRTISQFEPVNLSMTLWAFARAGFLDERLFRASAEEVKRKLPDFQPQQIANTAWAMAKSGFNDEELFQAAAELALEKMSQFQPMNYSMLLYSFAMAKVSHPRLFEEVGRRCSVQALSSAQSAPHVITNLAVSFAEGGVVNVEVFDVIAKVSCKMLPEFRTGQISSLAQAFARAEVRNDRLFAAISKEVVSRLGEYKQTDLQDLLAAYEALGVPTASISQAMMTQASSEASEKPESNVGQMLLVFLILLALYVAGRMSFAM
eukprot:TRINITY_DN21703_c0_g1_i1.p1 TRINITY_DN21703_c0_g1~~TRINITY_DN21703_c0_g1_i1.p1  ORF type:complete len:547 (+),score=147.25 TRINITY_DN21703_c0_g1_i1:154-1794(+)